jgi:hypothetical protein
MMHDQPAVAAYAACAVLLGLGLFQILLVGGAPLGHFAWGGQHLVLPWPFRIGSIVSVLLYIGFALVILDAAGVISMLPKRLSTVLIWVTAGYFLLGTGVNLISPSFPERLTMTPIAALLGLLSVLVARSR